MTNEQTFNYIKLAIVGTLCAALLLTFVLAFFDKVDPTRLVDFVLVSIGGLVGGVGTWFVAEAKRRTEVANMRIEMAAMQARGK